jgi:anaerobic magnesium-protoporphyrin IX monomethyl ester cyclase
MTKKILLINPPVPDNKIWVREGRCQQWDIWGAPFPPFSLAMISRQLVKRGFETKIIDSGPERKDIQAVLSEAGDFHPLMVFLATTSPTIHTDLDWFAPQLKEILPAAPVAAIGIHVSALPEKVLARYPSVDFLILGEPEISSVDLVTSFCTEKDMDMVNGIAFRSQNSIRITPPRGFADDIDLLDFPDWEKINFENYRLPILQKPFSLISFSRGCPFQCMYCATHAYNGRKLRKRSIGSLIREIRFNLSRGVSDFLFWTELMTADNRYLNEFLDALMAEKLDQEIRWVCNSRVDGADLPTMKKMKQTGCWQIAFGFEFGSDDILRLAKKGGAASIRQGRKAAQITADAGIAVDGHFIMGYPGETPETLQATIDYACSLPLTFAHFYAVTPFPGSPLYTEAVDNGWFPESAWDKLTQDAASIKTPSLTPFVVNQYIRKAYQQFYRNPKVILRILSIPHSVREYLEVFRLGFQFLRQLRA